MRVTSELFVAALTRRAFASGGFAAVLNRGAAEAGAVFVVARGRDGGAALYGPASQSSYEEGRPTGRRFSRLLDGAGEDALARRLERELRFDPDAWVVELEPAAPVETLIDIAAD